ncbi:MAG: hypothetical protein WCP45_03425 [Verrucomicrobiota bacterium]
MKKSPLLLPLLGISALMCSCVTYPYPGSGYAEDGPRYEPGYVVAYGEPLYVYGGMNYYYYGGRYCYLEHGRPIYVARIPYGAAHYRGPSYVHYSGGNHGGHGTAQPYFKGGGNLQGQQPHNLSFQGQQPRNPSFQGQQPHNLQGQQPHNLQGQQPHNLNLQGQQPHNPSFQKPGQGGGNQNRQGSTHSNQGQKKKDSDRQ